MRTLGVDCGDVIFYTYGGLVPGSCERLREIVRSGRFEKVFIISRANFLTRAIFLFRLRHLDFWNYTGIPRENLHFCSRFEDKAPICEKLGITDFIDDRLQVLESLRTVARRYALNPQHRSDLKKFAGTLSRVLLVKSWNEASTALLAG